MRPLILPLCLLTCLPLFTSCQKAGDAAAETSSDTVAERMARGDADVSQGKDSVTIDAGDAQLQIARDGKTLSMPADFPADVFVPAGLVVRSSMAVPRMLTVNGEAAAGLAREIRAATPHDADAVPGKGPPRSGNQRDGARGRRAGQLQPAHAAFQAVMPQQ